jgi:hypothetical protein
MDKCTGEVIVLNHVVGRIVNTVPLIVPVAINAMISIYDIADAMELRAFGSRRERTWYREVSFSKLDYLTIFITLLCLEFFIYLGTIFTGYWVPYHYDKWAGADLNRRPSPCQSLTA